MKKNKNGNRLPKEMLITITYGCSVATFITAWNGLDAGFFRELGEFVLYSFILWVISALTHACFITSFKNDEESTAKYLLSFAKAFASAVGVSLVIAWYLFR